MTERYLPVPFCPQRTSPQKSTVEIMVADQKKKTLILGSLDFKTTTTYDIQYLKIPMHVVNICLYVLIKKCVPRDYCIHNFHFL